MRLGLALPARSISVPGDGSSASLSNPREPARSQQQRRAIVVVFYYQVVLTAIAVLIMNVQVHLSCHNLRADSEGRLS